MSEPTILYCHLDDFYASIEQWMRPEARGRPVVVGDAPFPQGIVLSASLEAQALGISPGMPVKTAYQLAPGGMYLTADLSLYRTVFDDVLRLCADFTDRVEPIGLEGAFLDVAGCLPCQAPSCARSNDSRTGAIRYER